MLRSEGRGDRKLTALLTVLVWWVVISIISGLIAGQILRRLGALASVTLAPRSLRSRDLRTSSGGVGDYPKVLTEA